jgi:hypothetical protein
MWKFISYVETWNKRVFLEQYHDVKFKQTWEKKIMNIMGNTFDNIIKK